MKKTLIICELMLLAFVAKSQRRCGTMEYQQFLNDNNYSHQMMRGMVEQNVETYRTTGNTSSDTGKVTIPVVVHLIGNSVINSVTINDINDQIEILNEDYGRKPATNGYGNGVDTKIRFCLATKDAFGNSTSGIISINGNYPSWNVEVPDYNSRSDSSLKSLSHWPPTKYLNLYVVAAIYDNTPPPYDSTVYGYSTFPWDMLAAPEKDGIVIGKAYFGYTQTTNLDLGRTATHEAGHWLGLYHTFQRGENDDEQPCYNNDPNENGDLVWDTPPTATSNGPCNYQTPPNTCHTDNPDLPDQIENYMDYSLDACFNMFTQGQADRIRMILETSRPYAGYVSCFPSCSNGIMDGDETGVDCGGTSCNPCYIVGGGGSGGSGGGSSWNGCYNTNPNLLYDNKMTGCHTVEFKINSEPTWDIINVCPSNIILSAYNYITQQGNDIKWLYKIETSDKLCTKTDNMWQAASKVYSGYFNNHCSCWWLSLFFAVQECDENLNLIGTEYTEWKYFYDNDLSNYNELNVSHQIDLNQYLPAGFQFQDGKYYKVKIASYRHGNPVQPWAEHGGYIKTYQDSLFITNKTITRHQFADYIEIKNSTVPSANDIKVAAISAVRINASGTGNTVLQNGRYYIDTTINCNNISQFRMDTHDNNTGNMSMYDNGASMNLESNTVNVKDNIISTKEDWVKIFPNPAQNYITVRLQNTNTTANVALYNVSGLLVLSEKVNRGEQNHQIDVSALAHGFYIVEIQSENKQVKRVKIVKE